MTGSGRTLRQYLRSATAEAHDALDSAMRAEGGWDQAADYARFLGLQLTARVPVEAWLDAHAPEDLRPPRQTDLIAHDLAQLGVDAPLPAPDFSLEDSGNADTCLGAAWVLAGSSLGNRSILAELKKRGDAAAHWPTSFLGDEAMLAFWKRLRTAIEREVPAEKSDAAASGARAVFDHFLAHVVGQAQPADRLMRAS